ncbi:membrane protein containing DUF1112 [Candidatus Thiomargarita nelsonii]|uniref:Membrane protein containing DUF1112 n=1 Tax=Candidatus Thiomargarita nelsonii TaxID=1003181 RepID=A0A0A6RI04_9GAMM|nr:membrane protein containing DUF1112 [Candidatus Thiomargarita nelsonii]
MRTGNPALSAKTFEGLPESSDRMTINGAVNKTAMLLALLLITSAWAWDLFYTTQDINAVLPYLWIGTIGGFIVALVTIFKKTWSPITSPIYALLEGLAIGGISAIFEAAYPGIVIQAVSLTFGTLLVLLLAYKSGLIKVTENFKLGIVAATGAICLIYILDLVLRFIGLSIPFIHEGGFFGIAFSLFVVAIAAFNLVLDFDFIVQGAENGAPKYMEWYSAFGLLVTLVWLYLEILRLLAKTRR